MRRVLTLFAAVAVFIAVAFPQKEAAPALDPSIVHTTVVAQGLSARSLAIGPESSVDLALSDPANRLFTLSPPASTQPGPALVPLAGSGASGSLGDGGLATSAELSLFPAQISERSGVAVGVDGTIYVADTENGTIRAIAGAATSEPAIIRSVAGRWGPRQNVILEKPMGIALDGFGNLYIADHAANALDVLHHDTGLLETLAQITSPASVAVAPNGSQAFIASPESGAVFAVSLQTHSLALVPGLSSASNSSDGMLPCSSGSNRICPAGLAIDGAGNLFISDSTFGRILRVDTHTGAITAVLANLQQPGAISFDEQGRNLYVSEQGLNRIVEAQGLGDPLPNLSLTPPSWTFANEPVAGISPQEQFTLSNNSGNALSGVKINAPGAPSANGAFSLESTSCLPTLNPNATCAINVSFTPTAIGPATSTLSVGDSNQDSAIASLLGTGDDYQINLASGQPTEISVVEGEAATFHFQVAASGAFGQSGEQVSIFCPGNTPLRSTCTVTPPAVTATSTTPGAFAVTIKTSSPIVQAKHSPPFTLPPQDSPVRWLFPVLLFTFLIAVLFAVCSRRFRRPALLTSAVTIVLLIGGCHHASHQLLATPSGPAQILIQGSALSSNGTPLNATRAISVTLDVLTN